VINLPGSPDYNPSQPWVYKFWPLEGKIAHDFYIYVDDVPVMGST